MFLIPFNLSVELVGNKQKTFVGNMVQVPFAIGEALVSCIAIGLRDWQTFTLVSSAPLYLLLGLYFILPESPRWLIASKKYKEAKMVIEAGAKMNKVTIPAHLLEIPLDEPFSKDGEGGAESHAAAADTTQSLGFKDLVRTSTMRRYTIIMWINWIVVTLGYYGIR